MKENNNISMGSKGYYKLTILDEAGEIKADKSTGYTDNVVTYAGAFTALFNSPASLFEEYNCKIGTGTTEITRSSNGLGVPAATASNDVAASRAGNEVDNLDGTSTLTLSRTLTFPLGSQVGTFSEIGLYDNTVFIAGQLIKDEFGDPTTITILADEQLVVTYVLEWTVPNDSTLVGTGIVTDALSNDYSYEIWAQPYFAEYTVGSTSESYRYNNEYNVADEVGFFAANGTTSLFDSNDIGNGFDGRYSHNGSGVVTVTSGNISFSPSSGSWTDLVFVIMYTIGSNNSNYTRVVNTATALSISDNLSRDALTVKFLDPVTKTTNDSFSIAVSATINI